MAEQVSIRVHGESDDLVEVEGPCWDMGRMSDRGEYGAFDADNKPFLICDESLQVLARVYATYTEQGSWVFALGSPGAEEAPLPQDVLATTTACQDAGHSSLLTVNAPPGAFLVTPDDLKAIAAARAVEQLSPDRR